MTPKKLTEILLAMTPNQLQEVAEEVKKAKALLLGKAWKPEVDQKVWFVDFGGTVGSHLWRGDFTDVRLHNFFNAFPNEEDAQLRRDYLMMDMRNILGQVEFDDDMEERHDAMIRRVFGGKE